MAGTYNPGSEFTQSSLWNPNRKHPTLHVLRPHRGDDWAAPTGTSIPAAAQGKVVYKDWINGYGNVVILEHLIDGQIVHTWYAHMNVPSLLSIGDEVDAGDEVGTVGMTGGISTGPHLHFEIAIGGIAGHPNVAKGHPTVEPSTFEFPDATDLGRMFLNYEVMDSLGNYHKGVLFGTQEWFDRILEDIHQEVLRDNSPENLERLVGSSTTQTARPEYLHIYANAYTESDQHDEVVGSQGKDKVFGSNNSDSLDASGGDDYLNGEDGNDSLYGGLGEDVLNGGLGNDLLQDEQGYDTYVFESDFGSDVIVDKDGNGNIVIEGNILSSFTFKSIQGSDIIFRDESKKFEAIKIINGSSTDLLITSLTDATTGNVLIKNWSPEKSLGISLTVETSTPSNGSAGTVNGDGGNNAITLDNLRDNNPNLDISTFSALSADGGGGNDIIMGMLHGNDTLLGGAGDDIISGGFTSTLGVDASKTFQSVAAVPGADSIDGGAGNDFIFASAGGSIAHGGDDNDVLLSSGPAYFQFNNLQEVLADESCGITGHRAITRDEVYADALSRMNFGVEKIGLDYQLSTSYFKEFTSSYAEYNSAIENVKFIGKSGSTASNHSNGDVSYGFAGSYTLTYDYANEGELTPSSTDNPSPASMAISTFAPGAGKTLDDFANVKGANLFGDAGDDYLSGGIYADYLSGGVDNDVIFAGAGNDVVDGGDGNDELHGGEGRDIIIGGKGDDTLSGGIGNDVLVGGEGKDGFIGGDGDDILVGGVEDQYMSGGEGNNIYIFEDIVYEEADLGVAANNQNSDALGYASLASQTSTQATSSSAPLLTIESTEGNSTLALVGVSSLDQISLTAQENDLILRTGNAAIFIRDGLNGAANDDFFMDRKIAH